MAKKVSEIIEEMRALPIIARIGTIQENYVSWVKEIVDGKEVMVPGPPLDEQSCLINVAYYTDDTKEIIRYAKVSLMVKNAGNVETEEACHEGQRPIFMQTKAFETALDTLISENTPEGLQHWEISANEEKKKASIIGFFTPASGPGLVKREYFAFKKGTDPIVFKRIVTEE